MARTTRHGRVKEIDRGWRRLAREIPELKNRNVTVGIQQGEAPYDDGTSLALVALINELGTDDGRIPPRPAFAQNMDENRDKYLRHLERLPRLLAEGKTTVDQHLDRLGQMAEDDLRATIVSLREPPNADSTIDRKGSSNPLVEDGRLNQSVRYKVGRRR